jgi:hypothetical protein
MLKKLLGMAVAMLLVCGATILADEAKGKVTKWEKGTITVKVGDKDVEFKGLGKDSKAKVYDGDTEVTGKDRGALLKGSEGKEVTITYDKDGDKITVTKVVFKK